MASTTLTGSFSGTNASNYAIKCDCTSSSNGTSANSSNVTVKLYMRRTANLQPSWCQWNLNGNATARIIINGSDSGTGTTTFDTRSTTNWILLKTYTVNNIAHNSDGSKSISISAYFEPNATNTLYGGAVSGTFTLDTIPRAATLTSAPNFNDEQNPTISYSNPAGNSVSKLQACISLTGSADDIAYRDISKTGTSYTFNLTTAERNVLRNATPKSSRTVIFFIRTIINGTTYHSTRTVTLTIINSQPTFSSSNLSYYDSNSSITSITGNNTMIVQNKSNLIVKYSAATATKVGASMTYSFTLNGVTKTSTSAGGNIDFGKINSGSNLTLSASVTDSRNNTVKATKTITCYEYSAPYFSSFNAYRCNLNGDADENGIYIKYNCGLKFIAVNNTNSITVKIMYKKSTSDSYSFISPLENGTSTSIDQFVLDSSGEKIVFDIGSTYDIYAQIIDKYGGSSESNSIIIFSATRIFNITPDGTGVAIGKMAESNNLFECKWDAKFDGSASGPSGFSTSSDKRVKKNIQDININIIDNLQPVSYELLQSSDKKTHYGFIAQDVSAVLSDAGLDPETIGLLGQVFNNGRQEYVLTYTEFIPLLTKKCQDLQAEVNTLKEEISALKDIATSLQK